MLDAPATIGYSKARGIAERVIEGQSELRRTGRDQGGTQPFGWCLCEFTGKGGAGGSIGDPKAQKAIADILRLRCRDDDQRADG